MTASNGATTLRFQVGARTLAGARRRLHRVSLSLDDVLEGRLPPLRPLGERDGYLVTSLPAALLPALDRGGRALLVRQRYRRYWTDLTIGHAAWLAGLSGNARAGLKRKGKRLVTAGHVAIRSYRTADEIADFHALTRPLSALTYQERLLGSGLPADPASMRRDAAADRARGWLLLLDGVPIAYLYGAAEGSALRYDHVGHDPAHGALSPGTLLHAHAFAELFAERRFARFDFTEGEGQHKRQFATNGIDCVDVLLLRPTLANRTLLAALGGWDRAMAASKRLVSHPRLKQVADRIRR